MADVTAEQVLNSVLEFLRVTVLLLYYTLEGIVVALLPHGVLPRKSVEGKVILITGTGQGMGRIFAQKFGRLGAKLVLWDVNERLNNETLELLKAEGIEAYAYTVDVSKKQQIYDTAKKVLETVGTVDILFNNAGIVSGKKIFENSDEMMELTMAVNTTALFFTTKAFLPKMIEQNSGHVVTLASMAGKVGVAGLVDYCASKHGAVGYSNSVRDEVTRIGADIQVTTICPYYIDTGMFDGVQTKSPLLLPILSPEYVVDRSIEAILTNRPELILPKFCYIVVALGGIFPIKAISVVAAYLGANQTMDHFRGRAKKAA